MRGRDQPDVDLHRLAGADPFESLFLEDAEQLGLNLQADVADFVQENRAAVGQLETADLVADGSGEGPFDVAEEFAFKDAGGEGGTVDFHKRTGRPRAVVVDRLGQEPLTGSAFAAD